jgi:hypothetical protein
MASSISISVLMRGKCPTFCGESTRGSGTRIKSYHF